MITAGRRLVRTARARRRLRRSLRNAGRADFPASRLTLAETARVLEIEMGKPGGPKPQEVVAAFHELAQMHLQVVDLSAAIAALDRAGVALTAFTGSQLTEEDAAWT